MYACLWGLAVDSRPTCFPFGRIAGFEDPCVALYLSLRSGSGSGTRKILMNSLIYQISRVTKIACHIDMGDF